MDVPGIQPRERRTNRSVMRPRSSIAAIPYTGASGDLSAGIAAMGRGPRGDGERRCGAETDLGTNSGVMADAVT